MLKVIVPDLSNNGINVSRRTVNNVLNKCSQTRANTQLRKTFKKSSLRLEFVRVYLENVSDFWNSVLWGHETKIEFVWSKSATTSVEGKTESRGIILFIEKTGFGLCFGGCFSGNEPRRVFKYFKENLEDYVSLSNMIMVLGKIGSKTSNSTS